MRSIIHSAARAAMFVLPMAMAGAASAYGPAGAAPTMPVEATTQVLATGATLQVVTTDAPAATEPEAPSTFGGTLSDDRLDGMRGGDGNTTTTTNQANVNGRVNGNTATNVIGGGNIVTDGSFGNAAGISTVIQNSGSNVLIQNSTIVNIQFVPSP